MTLEKHPYWHNIIDHYYEHVHFESEHKNIYDWLEVEYGAVSSTGQQTFDFDSEKKAAWFALKWSH